LGLHKAKNQHSEQNQTHHNSTRHHCKQTTPITQNRNLRHSKKEKEEKGEEWLTGFAQLNTKKEKKRFNFQQKKRRKKECLTGFTKKATESEGLMILMIICLVWQTKLFHVKSPRSFCSLFLRRHQKRFSPAGSSATVRHDKFSQGFGFSFGFGLMQCE